MGTCDQLHDRQPKSRTVRSSNLLGPAETLERAWQEHLVEAAPSIDDVQLDDVIGRVGEEDDVPGPILQRVVHQVVERLLDPGRIRVHDRRRRNDVHGAAGTACADGEAPRDVLEQALDVYPLPAQR